jgi:hypothetical protein
MGAQHQDLARVGIGRAGLLVKVVAVIPADDQSKVRNGRERGRPSPDHCLDLAAAYRQEASITLCRAQLGGERYMPAGAEPAGERRVKPCDIPLVRDNDKCSPPGPQRGVNRDRDCSRPMLWTR